MEVQRVSDFKLVCSHMSQIHTNVNNTARLFVLDLNRKLRPNLWGGEGGVEGQTFISGLSFVRIQFLEPMEFGQQNFVL